MTSEDQARRSRIGIIIAAASALTLAINDVAVPFAYGQGFSAPTVVFFRFVFLLVSLAALLPLVGLSYRLPRDHALHALGSGIAAGIATLGLLGAFAYIPVSLALIILYTFPILTALFESAHARRLPSLVEFLCLIVALAGISIVIGLNEVTLSSLGLLFGAISALGYGASIFWNSIKLRNADGTVVSYYMAISGVATTALFLLATGTFAVTQAGFSGWLPLLVTCFFFTVSFIGMFKAVQWAGGAPTAMLLNLEPVFVMFLAALLLGEELSLPRLLGSAMVIGAVAVSEAWRNRKAVAIEAAG
ncbi:DMT family transporter [Taklimakanibacter deserti]|uniref:DMT family transporter n=1 Tax=Taklimakanibacter deserti TaxID=2267839 RepID=UPI000E6554CD